MVSAAPSWLPDPDGTGEPWPVVGPPLSAGRREQVAAAVDRATGLLGVGPARPAHADVEGALAALNLAWAAVTEALAHTAPEPDRLPALVDLLREVKAAEDGVRDDQAGRQAGASQLVREALDALSDVRSLAELAQRAPGAAATIGFDRVLLSRIEESSWVPEAMYVANDARWAEEILQAGRQELRTLDSSLLETQIVRRNRPLVVADTDRPDLHRALIDVTRTRSYAAAPVVGWGRVIGFLHADCYRQRRQLDRTDRDLLWMFCDGLGHLVVRTAAIDSLRSLRGELTRLVAGTAALGADAGWPGSRPPVPVGTASGPVGMPADASGPGPGSIGRPVRVPDGYTDEVEGALTRREVEVMRLMGAGQTNAQIARRLVISEGTVKSHVKHILRKLQAANRAEAVSLWLREEHARRLGRSQAGSRIGA